MRRPFSLRLVAWDWREFGVGVLGVALAWGGPTVAHSAEPTAGRSGDGGAWLAESVQWQAPASCPAPAALRSRLLEAQSAAPWDWSRIRSATAEASRGHSGWELSMQFDLTDGRVDRRHYTGASCEQLIDIAVLATSLALAGHTEPEVAWVPSPAPVPAPPPSGPPTDKPPSPWARAWQAARGSGGVEGLWDPGALGASALGVSILARADWSALSVGLRASWLNTTQLPVADQARAAVQLTVAGAEVCYRVNEGLRGCGQTEVGRLLVEPQGLASSAPVSDGWWAPGANVQWLAALTSSLALQSRLSVLAPRIRPRYFVNSTTPVHQVPAAAMRLGIALTYSGS